MEEIHFFIKKGEAVSMEISENGYYVTNELGEIHISGLPLGKYELKEVQRIRRIC